MKVTKGKSTNNELPRSFMRAMLVTAQRDPDDSDMVVCAGCGCEFAESEMTLDHRDPKSGGGGDDLSNLVLLCNHCNQLKGDTLTIKGLQDAIRKHRLNSIATEERLALESNAERANKQARNAARYSSEKELARSLHNKFESYEEIDLASLEIPLPDDSGTEYKRAIVIRIGRESHLTPNHDPENNDHDASIAGRKFTYRELVSRGYTVPGEPILRARCDEPGPFAVPDHPLCLQLHQKINLDALPSEWVPCGRDGLLSHVNDHRPLPAEFASASHFVPDEIYGHLDNAKRYISVHDLELAHSSSWTRNMGLFLCNDELVTTSVDAFNEFLKYVPSMLKRFVYPYWMCSMFALSAKVFAVGCGQINTVARVLDRPTTDVPTPHFYNAVILWDPDTERAVERLWEPQTGKWIDSPNESTIYTGRGKIDWC